MGRKPEVDKPQQQAFTRAMAATGDGEYAATVAGYKQPAQSARNLMLKPAVVADVRTKQLKRLVDEALPLAVSTVIDVMSNEKSSERGRLIAAKIVLDRVEGMDPAIERKEAHEMTYEELQKALRVGEARLVTMRSERGQIEDAEIIDQSPAQGVFE